ncbi:hypothetical protein [Ciceribacter ferrooxidans]|nr:hypothetical protein [Ciceribacter ferrooxidans]
MAVGMAIATTMGSSPAARAQVVIYEDQPSGVYSGEGRAEGESLRRWNRRHDTRDGWTNRWASFGPYDAIRLLERRGYRVRDVTNVGERYLLRASRDGDDLLVSVSRRGEIVGVVHEAH